MSLALTATALLWGLIAAYLAVRAVDSLLGVAFCLHGLVHGRWKRLARRVATGVVKADVLLDVLVKLALYAALYAALLYLGNDLARYKLRFSYAGPFALAAGALILARLPATWRRLVHYWRLSHQFDYAERRRRTQLLR